MAEKKFPPIREILNLRGIEHFILIDNTGGILDHSFSGPDPDTAYIHSCADALFRIGKTGPEYCLFKRKNQEDFFIFPVGNYYLGVIKQKKINALDLADTILNFLAGVDISE